MTKPLDNRNKVTISRSVYLRHCVWISLRKRLPWLLASLLLTGALLAAIKLPPGLIAVVLVCAVGLWTTYIGLGSWQRHRQD